MKIGQITQASVAFTLHAAALFGFFHSSAGAGEIRSPESETSIQLHLQISIESFDNDDAPLIQTLVRMARAYRFPLGIESVTEASIREPVKVRLERGTLKELLNLAIDQADGVSWGVNEGVIHVYSERELHERSNLFNQLVPSFSAQEEPLPSVNRRLRNAIMRHRATSEERKELPGGIIASFPSNPDHNEYRVSLELKDATVREVLNRMVEPFSGDFIWMARVPPERLATLPTAGLWQLFGPETDDPSRFLERSSP